MIVFKFAGILAVSLGHHSDAVTIANYKLMTL